MRNEVISPKEKIFPYWERYKIGLMYCIIRLLLEGSFSLERKNEGMSTS